jgi:hypothetical protein
VVSSKSLVANLADPNLKGLNSMYLLPPSLQDPISKPMLMTLSKKSKKDAIDIFKLLLAYTGDRVTKGKTQDATLVELSKTQSF